MWHVCASAVAGVFLASPAVMAQGVWDATAQFSPTLNPSGAWWYGFKQTRTGPFLTMPQNFEINGVSFWAFPGATPNIGVNTTNSPRLVADDPVVPPGVMMMHPGQDGGVELESVLRWIAPRDSVVRAEATFGGMVIDPDPTSVDVSVQFNGAEVFSQEILGVGAGASYAGTFVVGTGDVIDFQVGQGANANIFNDSTAVRIRVIDCLVIDQQPRQTFVCSNQSANFSIAASGVGTLTYRWMIEDNGVWRELEDGPFTLGGAPTCWSVVGTSTSSLTVNSGCGSNDAPGAFAFACVVSTSCGSISSDVATMSIRPCPCSPADLGSEGGALGGDGFLDNNDFIVFISLFFEQSPEADLGSEGGANGGDGFFDNNDFIVFIQRFFEGC